MRCTEKERETCNYEKLGCKGCFYNENKEEDTNKDKVESE